MEVRLVICDRDRGAYGYKFPEALQVAAERLFRKAEAFAARAAKAGLEATSLRLTQTDTKLWFRGSMLEATVDLGLGTVWFRQKTPRKPTSEFFAVAQIERDHPHNEGLVAQRGELDED